MKIVIILPTYNEKINIKKLIPILEEEVLPKIKKHEMSILIVDDNSPDGTAEEVRECMKKWKNISLLLGEKEGLGAAYVRGMHYAMDNMNADAVIEFDADFQHDPQDIPRLITAMDEGADYVIGSRYVPGGAMPKEWGIHRKLLSLVAGSFFTRLVWLNFSIHDMTSGFKLTKTSFLKRVNLDHIYSKYYAYKLHILHDIVKQKAKIKEVPIIFYDRKDGSSKLTGKDLFDSLWVVIRLRIDDSMRFIKFLVVGGTGFLIQLISQEGSVALGFALFLGILLHKFLPQTNIAALRDGAAAAIGAELAILSNFFLNNFWTFQDTTKLKQSSSLIARLLKFNVASLGAIIIQFAAISIAVALFGDTIQILHHGIKTRIIVLFPTIIFLVIPLNYIIYNKIIWKTQYLKKELRTKD